MKKELTRFIREKEIQLAKLKEHVEKSSVCSDLYNKVVLEKAILKKELGDEQVTYMNKDSSRFKYAFIPQPRFLCHLAVYSLV